MLAWKYLIGALASITVCTAHASCIDYGPARLTGTVVRQTYAGPPDYESVTKGDQPLVIWVLQLDPSLCVIDAQGRYSKEYAAREIQLQWQAGGLEPFRALLGRKVTVTGELIRGGARHDKRLVIVASEIGAAG
jgi:hypothetical protein